MLILALLNWVTPKYKTIGEQMLVLSMWEENLSPGNTYKTYNLSRADIDRVNRLLPPNDYIARSYVAGATPSNNYKINRKSIGIKFRTQDKYVGEIEKGTYKVFVWSGGADTARPVTLKRNSKGLWKVHEFSSLTVGIRPPKGSGDPSDDL